MFQRSRFILQITLGLCLCAFMMAPRNVSAQTAAPSLTAQSTANVDRPIQIDEATMQAHALTKVAPVYPAEARQQALTGSVVLYAIIDEQGKVKSLDVLAGPEVFRIPALQALNQWTFQPYQMNGQPAKVGTTFTIQFAPKN